ncbi:MAG: restriction endonuclease subunit S [Clostridium sp.]|nr:restriction endonuclease subunit S [Clostridium sp.]
MAKVKKEKLSLEEMLEQALVKAEDIPYEVPENWVWTRLDAVAKWGSGGTPSRNNPEFYIGDIPWIKTGELNNDYIYDTKEKISLEAIQKSSAKIFPINAVVIAMYGATIGKMAILGVEATTNQACACGFANSALFFKYLFYYLLSQKDAFIKKGKGGAQPNISQEVIKQHEIPLSPIAEQQRIVDVIESLFEKLDAAKELAQNALDSFENRKAAILHKAFTGELTAKWREENGVSLNEWQERNLKSLCKISSGGTPSRKNDKYYTGEIAWVKTGEIKWNYIDDSEEKITECAIKNSSAKLFPIGTVLVAMYGQGLTRGRAAILDIEATTNQAVCALIPNSELLNKYLYYYFMCNYWKLREKAVGGNQPNFSGTSIGGFIINTPILQEQKEIVRVLDNLLENEQTAKELCDVLEKIDLMKKAILARAFRGQLGTNDPEEESAVELLKEVLKEKIY